MPDNLLDCVIDRQYLDSAKPSVAEVTAIILSGYCSPCFERKYIIVLVV